MRDHCYKCGGDQQQRQGQQRVIRHALPQLASPVEVETPLICAVCGSEVGSDNKWLPTDARELRVAEGSTAGEYRNGHILRFDGRSIASLNYPGRLTGDVLLPTHEGHLSHGEVVDRNGEPDLMAAFAVEYLKQHRAIMPKGRLPLTVSEMMPALHLLVVAAELALKAYLLRSSTSTRGHDLQTLYGLFRDEHRCEIESRFASMALNANLKAIGEETVTVDSVLRSYGEWVGTTVYNETRYFAEPTTQLKRNLKGATLTKGIRYPIFLPFAVETLIDVYPFFSGAERLKRRGADVRRDSLGQADGSRGGWGLVPRSVGLVVLCFAQRVALDDTGVPRDDFRRFKDAHPAGFETSWMYGGNTLLFYRAQPDLTQDGEAVVGGLQCRVWSTSRLGMHARDLYRLADALEALDAPEWYQWTA